jgi:hypothetical protein
MTGNDLIHRFERSRLLSLLKTQFSSHRGYGLKRLRENSDPSLALKGRGFSRAAQSREKTRGFSP